MGSALSEAHWLRCSPGAGTIACGTLPQLCILEGTALSYSKQFLHRACAAAALMATFCCFLHHAVVTVTVRVLMKACSKHGCGFFGSGGFIIFEIEEGQVRQWTLHSQLHKAFSTLCQNE